MKYIATVFFSFTVSSCAWIEHQTTPTVSVPAEEQTTVRTHVQQLCKYPRYGDSLSNPPPIPPSK